MVKRISKEVSDPAEDEGLRPVWMRPDELPDNPLNWRTHPQLQVDALRDVIAEVGWAGALLYNERTGRLVDGHARKGMAEQGGKVPVLVGSWSEEQERKILATLDPLGGMAEVDTEKLNLLLREVQTESEPIAEMLTELMKNANLYQADPPEDFPEVDENIPVKHVCPKCGYQFSGGDIVSGVRDD